MPAVSDQENNILPSDIGYWPIDWKAWVTPLDIMKHDLVTNLKIFFPNPRGIHVILSNYCNLKCVMCPYHSPVYKDHHTSGYFDDNKAMSFEIFKKIADYAGINKASLQFGQIEEPLMFKKIYDYIAYAKNAGVESMHITTNGTPLNKNNANLLASSGITSLMVSLDAADADTYKKIRGTNLKQVEDNLKYFIPLAKKNNIIVWVSFILQGQLDTEKEEFLMKWQSLGVDNVTFYVLTDHDKKTGAFIRNEEHYNKGSRYTCASPWYQSVVFPDGEVSLCCKTMTDVGWKGIVSVGSLENQSFNEIWSSSQYNIVRHELLLNEFNQFKTCSACEIWSASTSKVEESDQYVKTYNETMKTYSFKRASLVD